MKDRLERLAEARRAGTRVGDLVVLAGELERLLPLPDRAEDLDVLARLEERLAVGLTPCQPSTTWGPDRPIPQMKRPPESASMVAAVIAVIAGVRAGICMIPVASLMFFVCAPIQTSGEIASEPYASAVQIEWNPSSSASFASATWSPIPAPE